MELSETSYRIVGMVSVHASILGLRGRVYASIGKLRSYHTVACPVVKYTDRSVDIVSISPLFYT